VQRSLVLLLGILAIAGLDLYALGGGAFAALALAAIAALFAAGFSYLDDGVASAPPAAPWRAPAAALQRADWLAAAGWTCASFALSAVSYAHPSGEIFDEVYFARAAREYLHNVHVYESTHPPLSKLLITLSVLLFGGLPAGDTSYGWRFLDVVFSALAVGVLYALARRVTGSALFAAIAAALLLLDGMHFVQSRIATPEGLAVFFSLCTIYALFRYVEARPASRAELCWAALFGVAAGCMIATKWYGVTLLGAGAAAAAIWKPRRPRTALALGLAFLATLCTYALAWTPDLLRDSPDPAAIHTVGDVIERQYQMYVYHSTLRATHPYSSKWWEWPLDLVPVVYYYQPDPSATPENPQGCCIREVTSMPNPINTWFGLFAIPFVAWLAWTRRRRDYALAVLVFACQWLPWSLSPRISWEYHFYVDIPMICLCNAIALQRLRVPRWAVAAALASIAGAFVYFYPVLAAQPLSWEAWHARMWFPTWIIGPG